MIFLHTLLEEYHGDLFTIDIRRAVTGNSNWSGTNWHWENVRGGVGLEAQ